MLHRVFKAARLPRLQSLAASSTVRTYGCALHDAIIADGLLTTPLLIRLTRGDLLSEIWRI